MNIEDLEELRAHYDSTDTSDDLASAVFDESVDPDPMVGITVRLPARVLNGARNQADAEGRKVTALIRTWIEQAVAAGAKEQTFVKTSDLNRLIATASGHVSISRLPIFGLTNVVHGRFEPQDLPSPALVRTRSRAS